MEFKKDKDKKTLISDKNDFAIIFYGDTLKFKVHHSSEQDGHYVRFVLSNGLQILYKYDTSSCSIVPYLYSDGKKTIYANNDAKEEYTYIGSPRKETSWFSRLWAFVSGWFSSDSSSERTLEDDKNASDNKQSWWNKTWSAITGLF